MAVENPRPPSTYNAHFQYYTYPSVAPTPGIFYGPWYVCPRCGGGFSEWASGAMVGTEAVNACPWCGLEAGKALAKQGGQP
jgi:hypothetical protein